VLSLWLPSLKTNKQTIETPISNQRYISVTLESARSSFPADCALVKQSSPALCEVLPSKHSTIFNFSQSLWLQLVVYVSKSRVLLVDINQRIHLYDGVFNQTQCPRQILMLLCSRWRWEGGERNCLKI